MNCERVRLLVDVYSTDELDLATALDVEEHLESCPGCAGELESLRALRSDLRAAAPRYTAPLELRCRVSGRVDGGGSKVHSRRPGFIRFGLAAAVAALLLLPWLGLYWNTSRADARRLAAEVTASHIRSLMADHLVDVPSTDQHTVKPWFNGKLDFSPAVVDLTADGFSLVGGRLDYVNNRPVAVVVYRRREHLINVFTWPSDAPSAEPSLSKHNGYNLVAWDREGVAWIAVSDLNPQELRHFVDLHHAKLATRL